MEDFIGSIKLFAGDFAPYGWAFCHGQIMTISSNEVIHAVLGNQYGGDGIKTFALPDLRGRVPVGTGHGPYLEDVKIGAKDGADTITLTVKNLPAHKHDVSVNLNIQSGATIEIPVNMTSGSADSTNPGDSILTDSGAANFTSEPANGIYAGKAIPVKGLTATVDAATCKPTGEGEAIPVKIPRLGMNYIICIYGDFPRRN